MWGSKTWVFGHLAAWAAVAGPTGCKMGQNEARVPRPLRGGSFTIDPGLSHPLSIPPGSRGGQASPAGRRGGLAPGRRGGCSGGGRGQGFPCSTRGPAKELCRGAPKPSWGVLPEIGCFISAARVDVGWGKVRGVSWSSRLPLEG